MLSTNVLCMKKRKKRSYCISEVSDHVPKPSRDKSSLNTNSAMMHITEDTPPDMLAGAMDLTVHLPPGKAVKMSVERSTPMMDLLVHITTTHHLQLSGHILQALETAPSSNQIDKVLPYKPNTPIGALDIQHIKVIPKSRNTPVPKNIPPGHQPFESTFRLQVHLPRNQLYVIRVSQHVYLDDIMKKVCEEKNLDPHKYEFRHPGNLDEVLDPKLTLSDYQITEIYVVSKGTVGLSQAFSSSDIMALRKEEERKQMHAKTGGGVFNLIFKRGKTSGSGSLSSENRSISPTHSEDSRSVTPPVVQQQIIAPAMTQEVPPEKPKPPQRKRRPAPKPPEAKKESPPTNSVDEQESQKKNVENGLTICHSRNSSDSSGYHEASVLSDNCNTTLPRRPKSTVINQTEGKINGEHSRSSGNLTQMASHSKSTSSLIVAARKKKAAPPPPPVLKSDSSALKVQTASPVVTSQSVDEQKETSITFEVDEDYPKPKRRNRTSKLPIPRPRSFIDKNEETQKEEEIINHNSTQYHSDADESVIVDSINQKLVEKIEEEIVNNVEETINETLRKEVEQLEESVKEKIEETLEEKIEEVIEDKIEGVIEDKIKEVIKIEGPIEDNVEEERIEESNYSSLSSEGSDAKTRPPEIVGAIRKKRSSLNNSFDTLTRKRGFQIGVSMFSFDPYGESLSIQSTESESTDRQSLDTVSINSHKSMEQRRDDLNDFNLDIFHNNKKPRKKVSHVQELHGMHSLNPAELPKNDSMTSLRSLDVPGFLGNSNMKKWNNLQELDHISMMSDSGSVGKWVVGDTSDSESISTAHTLQTPRASLESIKTPSLNLAELQVTPTIQETPKTSEPIKKKEETVKDEEINELEGEWQYQLPSPPTAFRDSSPTNLTVATNYDTITLRDFKDDSVVTSPELFEKLKLVKENETDAMSELNSVASEYDRSIFSKLSLENLEKRKSLVYNRELTTSLKLAQETTSSRESILSQNVLNELEDVIQKNNSLSRREIKEKVQPVDNNNLPNFKITTYDNPKKKINIFEDDSIRSNVDLPPNRNSSNDTSSKPVQFENNSNPNHFIKSSESVSYRKNSLEDNVFKKPVEFSRYKTRNGYFNKRESEFNGNVARSESFSSNVWKPLNPVKRSKSQVALNGSNDGVVSTGSEEGLTKSNSLFDVSGLQSLEVMRMIQTKLNTPTASTQELNNIEETKKEETEEIKAEPKPAEEEKPKMYQYHGPPAINLSTWSERPKTLVSLKEDTDYKINDSSKVIINTTNISVRSTSKPKFSFGQNDYLEKIKVNGTEPNNVSIKVNGSEPISQKLGNVVIKIGNSEKSNEHFSTRFINHASAYRTPLGDINKNEANPRPHSIALDSNFDISRVPIVRSVELKKPYKDAQNNTTITQINSTRTFENEPKSLNLYNTFNNTAYRYSDAKDDINSNTKNYFNEPVKRSSSFLQNGPVVRGFRKVEPTNETAPSRRTWNVPNNYGTLPAKAQSEQAKVAPFSQSTLKRTDSNKVTPSAPSNIFANVTLRSVSQPRVNHYRNSIAGTTITSISNGVAPPPPQMPKMFAKKVPKKMETEGDCRDQLLSAIRNFGGKKGLRPNKS